MIVLISQVVLICYSYLFYLPASTSKLDHGVEMRSSAWHPLHLSSMDLAYTSKGGTIEISCRLFTDDLENALAKQFGVATDLSAAAKHKAMDELLKKYMAIHFKLQVNGKAISLNYLGFEKDREAVMVYIESAPVKSLTNLKVYNSLMYDLFDDQTNLMHMTHNGKRKSTKLDYPKTDTLILN